MKALLGLVIFSLIALPPLHADEYDEAINLIKSGKYKVAEILLTADLAKNGDSVRTRFALGYSAEMQKQPAAAYENYRAAIAVYRRTGEDAKAAERTYERLFAVAPHTKPVFQRAVEFEKAAAAAKTEEERAYYTGAAEALYNHALAGVETHERVAAQPPVGDAGAAPKVLTDDDIEANLGYKLKRHRGGAKRLGRDGHFYMYFDDRLSWREAQEACRKLGGYLATITSKEENDLIASLSDDSFHIGASDEANEGQWQWITGEPMTYTAWDINEPNGERQENFTEFLSKEHNQNRPDPNARWNDRGEWPRNDGFVCEWNE